MESSLSLEEQRSLLLLEFPLLLEEVAGHCSTARAAAKIRALLPLSSIEELQKLWSWVEEFSSLLERGDDLPFGEILDLETVLGEEREIPGPLSSQELASVGVACRELDRLISAVRARRESLPLCDRLLKPCQGPGALGRHLEAALESDGRIKDEASPGLRSQRAAVTSARSQLRRMAQEEMGRAQRQGWTSSEELVLRGERFCIPLKSGRLHELQGVIHDRSSTGHTFFVEPLPVVESANRLQEARLAVEEEEARILRALNREVAASARVLVDLYHRAVRLDSLRARARWGRRREAFSPILQGGDSQSFRLDGFRHPLLQTALETAGRKDELVPLDLELSAEDRVLLISGPNAGGKTVVLKSVGLAACMAQTGIPLPTRSQPELPVFDRIFLELGDDQSLADALSHFSAHLAHLQAILERSDQRTLVLLDEIGGGTDPVEGVALARAYLEALGQRAGRVLATTHYGQLKALVHELEGFRNAGMAYDSRDPRPLFRLELDAPGASRALEIAARMGFDSEILERAKELVGDESLRLNAVLAEMEEHREALLEARRQAELEWREGKTKRVEYEERARELHQRRREILDRAEAEAEAIVRNSRARIEALLQEIRNAGGKDQALLAARKAREEADRRAEELARRQQERRTPLRGRRPALIEVGARVRHARLGLIAIIEEVRGDRVTLRAGGRRILAVAGELTEPEGGAQPALDRADQGGVRLPPIDAQEAVSRIDVRGFDVDDAWQTVDKALDRCVLARTHHLEVVHGKGTGTLRRELRERLQRDPRVKSCRLADGSYGDDGLTLVEIPE